MAFCFEWPIRVPRSNADSNADTIARRLAASARNAPACVTRWRSRSGGTLIFGVACRRYARPQLCMWATMAAMGRIFGAGGLARHTAGSSRSTRYSLTRAFAAQTRSSAADREGSRCDTEGQWGVCIRMADAFRRFRQHPIYSTIGGLYATVLIGMTSLVWLGALGRMAKGQPFRANEWIALAAVSVLAGWYLNFMVVYHRLRRIDPEAYASATKDMGFIAGVFAGRTAPTRLHHALTQLSLDRYPASFRYHVRFAVLLNATLLWTFCVGVLILFAMSRWRK